MWDAVRLSLFEALQLIVATRLDEAAAGALRDFSPSAKLGLMRREPDGTTMSAFEQARRDLEDWCRRGLIRAHGFRLIGHFGQVATERTELSDYWSSDTKFNFETSVIGAGEIFKKVTLRRADIEALLSANDDGVPEATAEFQASAADVEARPAGESSTVASTSPIQVSEHSPVRNDGKSKSIKAAIKYKWPDGIPECLSAKNRNKQIRDYLRENGLSDVSDRQIQRVIFGGDK